jgi:hypothetical protein
MEIDSKSILSFLLGGGIIYYLIKRKQRLDAEKAAAEAAAAAEQSGGGGGGFGGGGGGFGGGGGVIDEVIVPLPITTVVVDEEQLRGEFRPPITKFTPSMVRTKLVSKATPPIGTPLYPPIDTTPIEKEKEPIETAPPTATNSASDVATSLPPEREGFDGNFKKGKPIWS